MTTESFPCLDCGWPLGRPGRCASCRRLAKVKLKARARSKTQPVGKQKLPKALALIRAGIKKSFY